MFRMINNYEEALEHFFQVEMLNQKGLIEYCKLLKNQIFKLKEKVIDLERDVLPPLK